MYATDWMDTPPSGEELRVLIEKYGSLAQSVSDACKIPPEHLNALCDTFDLANGTLGLAAEHQAQRNCFADDHAERAQELIRHLENALAQFPKLDPTIKLRVDREFETAIRDQMIKDRQERQRMRYLSVSSGDGTDAPILVPRFVDMRPSYFGHDEFQRYAPALKSLNDAETIRAKILGAFEMAEATEDEAERARQMTFVLVGAGPTGVELAASLAQMATLELFPGVSQRRRRRWDE